MRIKAKDVLAEKGKRPPKKFWDKLMKDVESTPKYKDYSKDRKEQIAGGIWWNMSKPEREKIRKEYA